MDWPQGATLPVLHAESREEVAVTDATGRSRPLSFRADRVDRADRAGTGLRFTDYKTGRPLSTGKSPATRRRHFLERMRSGSHLQAAAYLLAAEGEPAVGRYLYLRPDLDDDEREVAVAQDDAEVLALFRRAVEAVFAVWDAGSFFPRVVDPAGRAEPVRCSYCAVAEACLRGDSGARRRLFAWTAKERPDGGFPAAEEALLGVWRLPVKEQTEAAEATAEAEP